MQLILLTHSREVSKSTNTGQLIRQVIPLSQTIIWRRTEPDEALLKLIKSGDTALVYPIGDAENTTCIADYDNFIIIDSTWQEARKIFNRSPYLQGLPRINLSPENNSKYNLRRNQLTEGLCTAETAIELLKSKEQTDMAQMLDTLFNQFLLENNRNS